MPSIMLRVVFAALVAHEAATKGGACAVAAAGQWDARCASGRATAPGVARAAAYPAVAAVHTAKAHPHGGGSTRNADDAAARGLNCAGRWATDHAAGAAQCALTAVAHPSQHATRAYLPTTGPAEYSALATDHAARGAGA